MESECEPGEPSFVQPLRSIRIQQGLGIIGCEILSEYIWMGINKGFECLVAIFRVSIRFPSLCLGGVEFWCAVFLLNTYISFQSQSHMWAWHWILTSSECELKVSIYWILFSLPADQSRIFLWDSGDRVGLVTTWLILPVVICLSQRLSHACLSVSFYTAKLRMAH